MHREGVFIRDDTLWLGREGFLRIYLVFLSRPERPSGISTAWAHAREIRTAGVIMLGAAVQRLAILERGTELVMFSTIVVCVAVLVL